MKNGMITNQTGTAHNRQLHNDNNLATPPKQDSPPLCLEQHQSL
ncbi:MAG: hypothetical protein QG673_741 [Pseudomonadota bacterium]|nr:hypothetical protein [Pseudomonadota bacterium]